MSTVLIQTWRRNADIGKGFSSHIVTPHVCEIPVEAVSTQTINSKYPINDYFDVEGKS